MPEPIIEAVKREPVGSGDRPQVAVFIASKGRAGELKETLKSVRSQSLPPCQIMLSVTDESDLPEQVRDWPGVTVCIGKPGKTGQLNRGLKLLNPGIQVVAFLDDDVELDRDYLKVVESAFLADPDLVGLNGSMLVNGGIGRDEARKVVAANEKTDDENDGILSELEYHTAHQGLYGCCMSMRRGIFDHIQFDERLVLYSWLEDVDIGIRAQAYGRCGYRADARLVHLGVPSGRVSGLQFGFSQIMNPVYLATKGVLLWKDVFRIHMLKVLLANMWGVARQDRTVDRWGRLRGNLLALASWARGRIEPEKILSL